MHTYGGVHALRTYIHLHTDTTLVYLVVLLKGPGLVLHLPHFIYWGYDASNILPGCIV